MRFCKRYERFKELQKREFVYPAFLHNRLNAFFSVGKRCRNSLGSNDILPGVTREHRRVEWSRQGDIPSISEGYWRGTTPVMLPLRNLAQCTEHLWQTASAISHGPGPDWMSQQALLVRGGCRSEITKSLEIFVVQRWGDHLPARTRMCSQFDWLLALDEGAQPYRFELRDAWIQSLPEANVETKKFGGGENQIGSRTLLGESHGINCGT